MAVEVEVDEVGLSNAMALMIDFGVSALIEGVVTELDTVASKGEADFVEVVVEADAEVGTDDVGVFANEGGTVVDVEFVREASAEDGFFEGVVEGFGVLLGVVGGVGEQARVLVDNDSEVSGEVVAVETNELGSGAEVGHPEVVWEWGFESFLGTGAVLGRAFS